MSYSAEAVANEFMKLAADADENLTNMQLQKLVYIAQGFSLALLDKPLIFNNVHAWTWGPVYPKLYKKLKKYGADEVCSEIPAEDRVDKESDEYSVIRAVFDSYGHRTGPQLSGITHQEDSPWSITWKQKAFDVISEELIKEHYEKLLDPA